MEGFISPSYSNEVERQLKSVITLKNAGAFLEAAQQLILLVKSHTEEEMGEFCNVISYYMDFLESVLANSFDSHDEIELFRQLIIDYYYYSIPYCEVLEDIKEPLAFLCCNYVFYFPYSDMIEEYVKIDAEIQYHSEKQLFYVQHGNKHLFYCYQNVDAIGIKYNMIHMEQYKTSPHKYLTDDFTVSEGDIVLDIGAAEANFTLDVIECCKKAYVFEPDQAWRGALEATFEPWSDKVTIVSKLVSDISDENTIAIDDLLGKESVNFIKIDVEGYELSVLKGARNTLLHNDHIKVAVCTYHNADDADILSNYLTELGFSVEFSKGYMLFPQGIQKPPYFRRGLIRASKSSANHAG